MLWEKILGSQNYVTFAVDQRLFDVFCAFLAILDILSILIDFFMTKHSTTKLTLFLHQ